MSVSPIVIGLAAAVLAGFSRGFAAFGTALVYVPLMSAAFDVRTAVVTLFLVDLLPSAPYIYRASKETDYNTVFWMGASAVVFTPVGVLVLRLAPERMLMLIVSCFLIAVTLFNLLVGSFTFRESRRNSVVAGGLSGLTGGAVGLYGPPAMIYLLGIYRNPLVARSTAFVFLSVESLILGANYWVYKMYTARDLRIAIALVIPYGVAMWVGTRVSTGLAADLYRRIVICLLLALSIILLARASLS